MKSDRLAGLDFWKATLPILGPVYHSTQASLALGGPAWIGYVAIATHSFRMQAFFAMAGLLAGPRLRRHNYLLKRFQTLLIPALVLWALSSIANPSRSSGPISGGLMHLWFLYSLALLSVGFVLAEKAGLLRKFELVNRWQTVLIFAVPLLVAMQLFWPLPSHWNPTIFLPILFAGFYAPYFILGLVVSRNFVLRESLKNSNMALLCGSAALIALLIIHYFAGIGIGLIEDNNTVLERVVSSLTALGMTMLVLTICVRPTRPANRALRWLGAAGYTIYVLHLPILRPIYGLTMGMGVQRQFIIASLLSTAIPLVAFVVIQRSATLRFLFNGGRLPDYVEKLRNMLIPAIRRV